MSKPVTPPRLKPGSRIALVAPARKISPEDLSACIRTLTEWGLEVIPSQNLFLTDHQYAGNDETRLAALQQALDDPDLDAILCARGGYGMLRIIDRLDLSAFRKHPKWFIGFSDITPMLAAIVNAGVECIHGPMGVSFAGKTGDAAAIAGLKKILMEDEDIRYEHVPAPESLTRTGIAEGPLTGGNLTLLSHMVGTDTDFQTKNAILLIEDLDEYLYNVDRLLLHLRRAGKFTKLQGMIVGGMTDMKDNDTPFGKTAEEIVADQVSSFRFPVTYGFPSGHWPMNYPLVMGRKTQLRVTHLKCEVIQAK